MSAPRDPMALQKNLIKILIFAGSVIAALSSLLLFYQSLVIPIAVALFFTYLLAPMTDCITIKLKGRRTIAVVLILFVMLAAITTLVASIIPMVYHQVIAILQLIPAAMEYILTHIEPLREFLTKNKALKLENIDAAIREFNLLAQISQQAKLMIEKLWNSTPSLLGGILNIFLIPVLLFFTLKDLPKLLGMLKRIVPRDLIGPARAFVQEVDETLRSVLKGQVIVALLLGVMYMIGLTVVGLKYGFAIGAIAGICRIVPYLDVIVGMGLSFIVIVTEDFRLFRLLAVCAVFVIVQVLDGMIVTPRIVGNRAGLHPGVVIISIIAFADWFGFWGVLVAVPVVAIVMVMIDTIAPVYMSSTFHEHQEQKTHPQE